MPLLLIPFTPPWLYARESGCVFYPIGVIPHVAAGSPKTIICLFVSAKLFPDTYYDGWKVNERLAITGLPTIRRIAKEESVVWRTWQNQRDDAKGHVITPIKKINIRKKREEAKRMQLDLFD